MANTKAIALVLVGFALFGLVVCGGGTAFWYFKVYRGAAAPDVGPLAGSALALPADTAALGGIDVKSFLASAGYEQIASGDLPGMTQSMSPAEAEQAKKQLRESLESGLAETEVKTGIRLDRDIDRVVLAASNVAAEQPDGALIAIGRFDPAKVTRALTASAQAAGATLTSKTVAGVAIRVLTEPGKPALELAVDEALLVLGTAGVVDAIVTNRANRARPLETNASLVGLVKRLDPVSSYWLVLDQALIGRAQKEAAGAAPPVAMPMNLTLTGKYEGGLELAGEWPDEASAQSVVALLQQGLDMVKLQAAQSPEVEKLPGARQVLEGITLTAEVKRVKLTVPGGGGGSGLAGMLAALALPNLLRAKAMAEAATQGIGEPAPLSEPQSLAEEPLSQPAAPPTLAPAAPVRPRPTVRPPAPTLARRPAPDAPAPAKPVRVGGEIREPRKIRNADPVYPPLARQARVQGIVILEADIGADGRVTGVRVLRGVPLLDQAAIDAVQQWVYEPTLLNGVPVPVTMTVTVNFRMK